MRQPCWMHMAEALALLLGLTAAVAQDQGWRAGGKMATAHARDSELIVPGVPLSAICKEFEAKMFEMIVKLPGKKHCWFVSLVAAQAQKNASFVVGYLQSGFTLWNGKAVAWKSRCRHYRDEVMSSHGRRAVLSLPVAVTAGAVALFNSLPVTFQCHLLRMLTPLNSAEWTAHELLMTENALRRRYRIDRVVHRCVVPLTSTVSRDISRTVRLQGEIKNGTWSPWSRHLKRKLIKLLGKYAKSDPQFPQPRFQSARSSPSSMYHFHVVNVRENGPCHVTVDFHIHIKEADTKAIPAGTLLSALDRFNRTVLQRSLRIISGLNFTKIVSGDAHGSLPAGFVSGSRKQRLKHLLPVYMGEYFASLGRTEQCDIVRSAVGHSNTSMAIILTFLARRRIQRNLRCDLDAPTVMPDHGGSVGTKPADSMTSVASLASSSSVSLLYDSLKKGIDIPSSREVARRRKTTVVQATTVDVLLLAMIAVLSVAMGTFVVILIVWRLRLREVRSNLSRQHDDVTTERLNGEWPTRIETPQRHTRSPDVTLQRISTNSDETLDATNRRCRSGGVQSLFALLSIDHDAVQLEQPRRSSRCSVYTTDVDLRQRPSVHDCGDAGVSCAEKQHTVV